MTAVYLWTLDEQRGFTILRQEATVVKFTFTPVIKYVNNKEQQETASKIAATKNSKRKHFWQWMSKH